jgi:uncharacterized protein (TIGR02594 family)
VIEGPGTSDNPTVQAYYRDAGHPEVKHDAVPWCAAFVGAMLKRAGIKPSGSLLARSYLQWGKKLDKPAVGAIIVLQRGGSTFLGHVGFVVDPAAHIMLGGNQSDRVSIQRYDPRKVLSYRWPEEEA